MKISTVISIILIALSDAVFTGSISGEVGIVVGVLAFATVTAVASQAGTIILHEEGREYLASSFPNSQYFSIAIFAMGLQLVSIAKEYPENLLRMVGVSLVLMAVSMFILPHFPPTEISGDPKKPA